MLTPFITGSSASEIEYHRVKITSTSPDNKSVISGSLELRTPDIQKLHINNGLLNTKRVIVEASFRYEPIIKWHNNEVVEITIGTGSPGRYSVFYNLKTDKVSENIWFVLAYDTNRKIALLGDDRLRLIKVFEEKEIMDVKIPDIKLTAINFLVVNNANFDDNGNISINYISSDNQNKSIVIETEN